MQTLTLACAIAWLFQSRLTAASRQRSRIAPALDPVLDNKFFGPPAKGADYPTDDAPVPAKKVPTSPFPSVQHSDTFDKDFVKDENYDNGEWKLQMQYDTLQKKLRKERSDVLPARRREEEKRAELEEVRRAEQNAQEKRKIAGKAANVAKAADQDAAEEEHGARQKEAEEKTAQVDLDPRDVEGAKKIVKESIKHLEDCKRQLLEAQNALREATREQTDAAEVAVKRREGELQEAKAVMGLAEKALADAKAEHEHSEQEVASAEKKEKEVGNILTKEAQHVKDMEMKREVAKKKYDKEVEDVNRVSDELHKAEVRLRKLRHDGGPEAKKSGTQRACFGVSLLFAIAVGVIS
eukprot:TRINITY_DN8532_c0_g2_i1.p1 TRINITY_DN8532_c0_g2~~TRINITY_DN8532_c0_g2_i1.p1  ORF type:complete len:352 (+),score=97.03 TRINITY_DN8532_c0_g2_i1:70-1125(+)